MLEDEPVTGTPTTSAPCGGLLSSSSSRRQSSNPALCVRASSAQLADDVVDITPPASAADGHVTGSTATYPGFVERAFFVLDQTTRPRSWCLRLITWPYPLLLNFQRSGTAYSFYTT